MKDKTVCRSHGGKSTGPKTAEGQKRVAAARMIHGRYSLDRLKARMLERLRPAWDLYFDDPLIRARITPEQFASYRARAWTDYLRPKVLAMDWAQFRQIRNYLAAFCKGKITFRELTRQLDLPKTVTQRVTTTIVKEGNDNE